MHYSKPSATPFSPAQTFEHPAVHLHSMVDKGKTNRQLVADADVGKLRKPEMLSRKHALPRRQRDASGRDSMRVGMKMQLELRVSIDDRRSHLG